MIRRIAPDRRTPTYAALALVLLALTARAGESQPPVPSPSELRQDEQREGDDVGGRAEAGEGAISSPSPARPGPPAGLQGEDQPRLDIPGEHEAKQGEGASPYEWGMFGVSACLMLVGIGQLYIFRRQAEIMDRQAGIMDKQADLMSQQAESMREQAEQMTQQSMHMKGALAISDANARAAQDSASAARLNAEALIAIERPWLSVLTPDVVTASPPRRTPSGDEEVIFEFRIRARNAGRTTAEVFAWGDDFAIVPIIPPMGTTVSRPRQPVPHTVPAETIHGDADGFEWSQSVAVSQPDLAKINAGESAVLVYGVVKYRDSFDRVRGAEYHWRISRDSGHEATYGLAEQRRRKTAPVVAGWRVEDASAVYFWDNSDVDERHHGEPRKS